MRRLIICAHLDDEAYGLGGSLTKWSEQGDEIKVIVLCHGRGTDDIQPRLKTFKDNMQRINVECTVFKYFDLTLEKEDLTTIVNDIQLQLIYFQPEAVYCTSEDDLHQDHQIVSKATRIACRPTSEFSVKQLYEYYIPASSDWNFQSTQWNVFSDISNYSDSKHAMISDYKTEAKENVNHPGNPYSCLEINRADGIKVGYTYAEKMKLIYER